MDQNVPLPLPAPSEPTSSVEARRLWIGNLDKRVTDNPLHNLSCFTTLFVLYWLQLVKLLQNYGPIENFDLLYHKTGPDAGLPRGYAFVTFRNEESALKLKNALDGKKLGIKTLSIQWAHNAEKDNEIMGKRNLAIPALGVAAKKEAKVDTSISSKIQAIESKLKMMSQLPEEEFSLTNPVPSSSFITSAAIDSKVHQKPTRRLSKPTIQHNRFRPYYK